MRMWHRLPLWVRALFHFLLFLLALMLNVALGAVDIPLAEILRWVAHRMLATPQPPGPEYVGTILFTLRIPHAARIALTGMALAVSGAAYQGLFRNPLAGPYLLGAASGAGLAAVAAMSLPWSTDPLGVFTLPAFAFFGALTAVLVVYLLARVQGALSVESLILAGVAFSALASALTTLLMLRLQGEWRRALVYLAGGATLVGWKAVFAMAPYALTGTALLLVMGHALNVLQFGEEQALQLGLPVETTKRGVLFAASLATAAAVAFSGVIGFLGLMVPHLLRRLYGEDYRRLLPLSALHGATLLLLFDIPARWLFRPQAVPLGIMTSLAGAPFFLWVLREAQRRRGRGLV